MSDTFCPLLFNHLATHPFGGVSQCCIAYHSYSVDKDSTGTIIKHYNLVNDQIKDIYNSDSFKDSRLKSLNGEWPAPCARCKNDEEQGVSESKRQFEIRCYPDFTIEKAKSITLSDGTIEDPQFDFIELRLGNVCNVKCVTCNPYSSSKWVNDWLTLKPKLDFEIGDFNNKNFNMRWPESEEVWLDMFKHTKEIKCIYINGGEPTLNKQHLGFLQMLVDNGLTDVELRYNINGTQLPDDFVTTLKQFSNVIIGFSIDDLGERNYYLRYPTQWNDVLNSVESAVSAHGFGYNITHTISWMNFWSIGSFFKFWEEKFGDSVNIIHNPVYWPAHLSPNALPYDIRIQALEHIRTELSCDRRYADLVSRFGKVKTHDQKQLDNGIQYIQELDKLRELNFTEQFPEWKWMFNEK